MPKVRAALLALFLLSTPAWADPENAHPLIDRPFPTLKSLAPRPPCALLFWRQEDGRTMRRLGQAKLVELAGSNPKLRVYSVELTSGRPLDERPYGSGLVRTEAVPPAELQRLRTMTPVIITVDLGGRVHRVSQVDHWPTLSTGAPRFGMISPRPTRPWWDPRGWRL